MRINKMLSFVQQKLFSYFNLTKVSSVKSALKAFEEIISETDLNVTCTEENLAGEILKINEAIGKYDLEVAESVDEIKCEKVFVLINTADCVVTQKFKFYDDSVTQYFAKIVKDIMLSEEGFISETHCLNLNIQIKLSKTLSQSILESLVQQKWLISTNNKISLGIRSIVELEQNIKQYYPDNVKNCPFCKLIVIQGFLCKNCPTKSHFACLKKYQAHSKSNCYCPNCKEIWDNLPQFIVNEAKEQLLEDSACFNSPRKKKKKV